MNENTTAVNTEMEVAQEVTEMAKINMKTVGMIGLGVAAAGAAVFGVKKFVAPKIKKMHEDRKAKKLDKKLKSAAEVE